MSTKYLLICGIFFLARPIASEIFTLKDGPAAVQNLSQPKNANEKMIIYDDYYYNGYKYETPSCCKADVFEALCNEKVTPILQNMVRLGDHIYYFSPPISNFNPGKNWYQAQDMCRQYGMQLVSLETAEEDALVKAHVTTLLTSNNMKEGSFWTSLNDLSNEGSFFWAGSGEPAWTPTVWSSSAPSGATADCGQIVQQGASSVLWDDMDCKRPTRFICEMICPCNDLVTVI